MNSNEKVAVKKDRFGLEATSRRSAYNFLSPPKRNGKR
jgi:hypothetical protein